MARDLVLTKTGCQARLCMSNMQNPTSECVTDLQVLVPTKDKSAVVYIALTSATEVTEYPRSLL